MLLRSESSLHRFGRSIPRSRQNSPTRTLLRPFSLVYGRPQGGLRQCDGPFSWITSIVYLSYQLCLEHAGCTLWWLCPWFRIHRLRDSLTSVGPKLLASSADCLRKCCHHSFWLGRCMGACRRQRSLVLFQPRIVNRKAYRHQPGSLVEHLNQRSFRLFNSSSAHSPLSLSYQSGTQPERSMFQTPPIL